MREEFQMIKHAECGGAAFRYIHRKVGKETPTIVYVGGAFQSVESVMKCEEWLQNFSHLIIELPGFGESLQASQPNTFDLFASCIDTAVGECALQDFYGYAYSYGAGPMGRYIARYENSMKGLIVGGASASMTPEMEKTIERLVESAHCKKEFMEVFSSTFFYPNEQDLSAGRLSHSLVKRKLRSVTERELEMFVENYRTLLKEHKIVARVDQNIPVMVIGGELDTFVNRSLLNGFRKFCDNVEIFEISNADHFYYLQRPELLLYLVRQFIEKCDAPVYLPVDTDHPSIPSLYR